MYDLRSELIVSPTLNRRGDVVARTSSFCRRRWGEEIAEPEKSRVFFALRSSFGQFFDCFLVSNRSVGPQDRL